MTLSLQQLLQSHQPQLPEADVAFLVDLLNNQTFYPLGAKEAREALKSDQTDDFLYWKRLLEFPPHPIKSVPYKLDRIFEVR